MASNSRPALGFSTAPFSRRRFSRLWLSSYPLGGIERMKIRRLILIAGLLVAVAALASWLIVSRWQHSQAFSSLPKLAAAMRSYSHDQVSHGRSLPSSVTLQDLLAGGCISAAEVRDLAGADVTFYPTVSESDPQAILVRVRMQDGSQTVALADGSIQSVSR